LHLRYDAWIRAKAEGKVQKLGDNPQKAEGEGSKAQSDHAHQTLGDGGSPPSERENCRKEDDAGLPRENETVYESDPTRMMEGVQILSPLFEQNEKCTCSMQYDESGQHGADECARAWRKAEMKICECTKAHDCNSEHGQQQSAENVPELTMAVKQSQVAWEQQLGEVRKR
jgi:hypothetical protein